MWPFGVVAMLSYGLQCSLFDFTKRTFLSRHGARPLPNRADFAQIEAARSRARRDGRAGEAFLLWFYRQYFGTHGAVTPRLPGLAGHALTPARMRAWTWLGLGTHLTILYVALAVSAGWLPALLVALVIFATAGNALLVTLLKSA